MADSFGHGNPSSSSPRVHVVRHFEIFRLHDLEIWTQLGSIRRVTLSGIAFRTATPIGEFSFDSLVLVGTIKADHFQFKS